MPLPVVDQPRETVTLDYGDKICVKNAIFEGDDHEKFEYVEKWGECVEIMFDITNSHKVKGGRKWNGKTKRSFNFELFIGNVSAGKIEETKKGNNPTKRTYILIHGWKNDPGDWPREMAEEIAKKDPKSIILMLDWSDVTDDLNYSSDLQPDNEATWIKPVSEKAAKELKKWGIKRDNTTIIGHSLGTLEGGILSRKLGKVDVLVALDPAYKLGNQYNLEKGWWGVEEFKSFQDKAQFVRCFVGEGSISGSETLSETCDERFTVNFVDANIGNSLDEHNWVREKFHESLDWNELYDNMFGVYDRESHKFDKGSILADGLNDNFHGDLVVGGKGGGKVEYLLAMKGDLHRYYGTESSNKFSSLKESKIYTSTGSDEIYGRGENWLVYDFDKGLDKIVLKENKKDMYIVGEENGTPYIYYLSSFGSGKYYVQTNGYEGVSSGKLKDYLDNAKSNDPKIREQSFIKFE